MMEYRENAIRQIMLYLEQANERELKIVLAFIRSLIQEKNVIEED